MKKHLLVIACVFALVSGAFAQTKISGSTDCDKPDPKQAIQIPERNGFSFEIGQYKCTWTKPYAIEELQSKDIVEVVFSEAMGASVRFIATSVTHFGNGDRVYTRATGVSDTKTMISSGNKWTYTLGTGKLRGIKGGGTANCKAKSTEPDAGYTCEIEGEYTLPTAKK